MFGFNSKNKKLENLLRESRQDFGFDSENIKARVMMAVNVRHLSKDDVRRLTFNPSTWPRYVFGASLALILAITTTGFAFAANESKPGEVLFPIQKLQNQIVLSLPLSAAKKAEFSTNIVAKRLQELDEIQNNSNTKSSKVSAEVKEAQESIATAASFVPEQVSDNDNVEEIAKKLDGLSIQHQQTLQNLSIKTEDTELKAEIEKSVRDITATQSKLRVRKQKINDNDKKDRTNDGRGKNSGSNKSKIQIK
jgi:hypothetical protein